MITSGSSWPACPLVSPFLVSPHRLEPPCMLGMFSTATPSRDTPLRSSGVPQHWRRRRRSSSSNISTLSACGNSFFFHTTEIVSKTEMQHADFAVQVTLMLLSHLNCKTFAQFLAGSRDGFWSGKFEIPQLVLHPAVKKKYVFFSSGLDDVSFSQNIFLAHGSPGGGGVRLQSSLPQTSVVAPAFRFFFFVCLFCFAAYKNPSDRKNKSKTEKHFCCWTMCLI